MDLLTLFAMALLFGVSFAYLYACEHLKGSR